MLDSFEGAADQEGDTHWMEEDIHYRAAGEAEEDGSAREAVLRKLGEEAQEGDADDVGTAPADGKEDETVDGEEDGTVHGKEDEAVDETVEA